MLLLAADFYYTKNIAGRRLVGLRWWNEVDPAGESRWVFESSEPGTKVVNATDSRFFWMAMYAQPVVWVLMAVVAVFRFQFLWLPLVGRLPPFLPLTVPASGWYGGCMHLRRDANGIKSSRSCSR